MNKKLSNKEWEGFIDDYYNNCSSITVNEFCREHNLSKQQFHYHKKKILGTKDSSSTVFQSLTITSKEETVNQIKNGTEIKISIGNAKIAIPVSETTLISTIIKDLAMQC
ncbi:hypothetical protein J1C67_09255 [Clostridium gasigenes]|uniref:IS66 family insertion sequence element accessory protein TnpA n=1 Tax=Clostridium gasigenes TaxID=94869 RepID=UPI00143851C8|nr:hypothetical protein [Clostridium gasigenes]NKF08854.1 hypothetical protein [Clostridium gasigenes]QSW21261.1 hypothetical protein J1C67_09255 [Clostridium gasigenes]